MSTDTARSVTPPLTAELAREVVAASAAAPSIHNTQPWLWQLDAGGLTLFADRSRQLDVADPQGRQLLLSCGAALCNARLALRIRGLSPQVTLLPDGDNIGSAPLARVTLAGSLPADDTERALAAAIPRRHTDRRPFEERPLPADAISRLRAAAEAEGAWLTAPTDPDLRVQVSVLLSRADWIEEHNAAYRAELSSWSRTEPAADGIPRGAVVHLDAPRRSEFPLRDLDVAGETGTTHLAEHAVERPGILLIGTDADTTADRLRAGEAMQRVLLAATALGLASSPMSQAIDVEGMREQFRGATGGLGHVQMILRVGYPEPTTAPAEPTPRREVNDILRTVDTDAAPETDG
ncbi:Nitroreductase [Frankia canadensis]|uniref:Nitroreductase n=1 Tax=Frankia canadensis TaxID=1836972 RepID=A0A2I2KS04_9ACTN|nr:nitroreductase family protein [Frankia canadensis]SNQ48416.1 Nitroreductase [Frankia canadensis]SOU55706.1 Nitroreductase [Frankia canadensis]